MGHWWIKLRWTISEDEGVLIKHSIYTRQDMTGWQNIRLNYPTISGFCLW